jgi:nicotinate-nucleotide pyrophosphorylase (carboxylating)
MESLQIDEILHADIRVTVARALQEDIGTGDRTAELIPATASSDATIMTRERTTLAGCPWVKEVFAQLDPSVELDWLLDDGATAEADAIVCRLRGPTRPILTGERTALNLLQTLSATATHTAAYVHAVSGTGCQILDTRKTLPGLRLAQKYAVRCGGGRNHRIGLFDAILIKENHIESAGGISAAIASCRKLHPTLPIEIEVESIEELREALAANPERLLLDNFSLNMLRDAVAINRAEGRPPAELEASGGLSLDDITNVAKSGVNFISVGALTKNIKAIDFSMRFQ